jgi:hypothetical protein
LLIKDLNITLFIIKLLVQPFYLNPVYKGKLIKTIMANLLNELESGLIVNLKGSNKFAVEAFIVTF